MTDASVHRVRPPQGNGRASPQRRTPEQKTGRPLPETVVVLGPTASGKTRLGVALARRFGGEIISADSRQVYRGMDIGTGKDLDEYGTGEDRVPVHLVDVVDPVEEYDLFRYVRDAQACIRGTAERARLPIVVGGSGLYLYALLKGLRLEGGPPDEHIRRSLAGMSDAELLAVIRQHAPDLVDRIDTSQRRRLIRAAEIALTKKDYPGIVVPPLPALVIGVWFPRRELHERIRRRLEVRIRQGLIEEVRRLHAEGLSWERLERFGLEYRWTAELLQGRIDEHTWFSRLLAAIRQFCRRQDVWFRKMEREGIRIHWIRRGDPDQAVALVEAWLEGRPLPEPEFRLDDIVYDSRGNPRRRRPG